MDINDTYREINSPGKAWVKDLCETLIGHKPSVGQAYRLDLLIRYMPDEAAREALVLEYTDGMSGLPLSAMTKSALEWLKAPVRLDYIKSGIAPAFPDRMRQEDLQPLFDAGICTESGVQAWNEGRVSLARGLTAEMALLTGRLA